MVTVAPNRYNFTSVAQIKHGVVVHTSEGGELPTSYRQLVDAFAAPGSRSNPGGVNPTIGASYHAIANPDDGYTELTFREGQRFVAPYSAPPVNGTWWHICIPGRAAQTRTEWLDANSRPYITGVAKFIVDKRRLDLFPLDYCTPAELLAGKRGYTSHNNVSLAWRKSTHTDPGKDFPWDVLAADIAVYVAATTPPVEVHPPTPEEDDVQLVMWKHPQHANVWLLGAGSATHLSPLLMAHYTGLGVPLIVEAHAQTLKACLFQSGLADRDLVEA